MSDIKDLKFDDKNFNKHTEFGMGLLEKSLNKFGAGRSILVDKDNNIIAGNGIVEAAANAGLTKTKVVETTGDELVVVKRTDVALDSAQGREMALADNATAQADLEWDEELLRSEFDDEDLDGWGISLSQAMLEDTEEQVDEITPEPTVAIFVVSMYAREKNRGSTILAQKLTQEMADKIQEQVNAEGGAAIIQRMLGGLE